MSRWAYAVLLLGVLMLAAGTLLSQGAVAEDPNSETSATAKVFSVYPIGYVQKKDGRTFLVLEPKYQAGLLGLADWSHVHVIWWFDRNDTPQRRAILQVHPRGDKNNPLTGVFACRAPVRPNLIGLTLCKIVAVKDNVVEVEDIDAFDGTPIIDLKPFSPGTDCARDVRVPAWAGPRGN